jgi:hypothetical protein
VGFKDSQPLMAAPPVEQRGPQILPNMPCA